MNEQEDNLREEILKKLQGPRAQTLKFLTMIGMLVSGLGALDLTQAANFLPDPYGGWLLAAGLFMASLEKGIYWLGDMLDNGKRDKSFKLKP